MTIQGMSQGLAFSNMSYYLPNEIPAITPCDTPPLLANNKQGVYNTAFDMGTASGAAIIVFEVGGQQNPDPTVTPIVFSLGDKLQWKYRGNYSSEYSFAQMGESQPTLANGRYVEDYNTGANNSKFRLMGRGYGRGVITSGFHTNGYPLNSTNSGTNPALKSSGQTYYGNKAVPLDPYNGSRLLPRPGSGATQWRQPYLVDPNVASSTGGNAFVISQQYPVCDTEHSTGGSQSGNGMQSNNTVYPATKAVSNSLGTNSLGMDGGVVITFGTTSQHNPGLATNLLQHGQFCSYVQPGNFSHSKPPPAGAITGVLTYDWVNGVPTGSYNTRTVPPTIPTPQETDLVKQFLGPYTGHDEPEIPNPFADNSYPGSSGITLDYGRYATRQGMMVVPVINGSIVRCRLEAPFAGTYADQKIFCPIELPKWGGANNLAGCAQYYADADLHASVQIQGGTTTCQTASTNSTTLLLAQDIASPATISVNHLITGTGIPHGTFVTNVQAVSNGHIDVTLTLAASVASGATITFHKSKIRSTLDSYNTSQTNLGLPVVDPTNTTETSAFFDKMSKVLRIKPYNTHTDALNHNFTSQNSKVVPKKFTAYHVPSQNAKYRGQGYAGFKAGGVIGANAAGGGPESNHGEHVLGAHGSRSLAWDTLNSTDALAHHGVVNEADWVFTRSNGARRSRLPARGVLDITKYANNNWNTVGGWYAMKIGSNQYAVQVGSLDYSRGEITVDVIPATSGTSGTVPRDGVARIVTT